MIDIVGRARLHATNKLISRHVNLKSVVVEIGASDASFAQFHGAGKWITVDKYGTPDIKADLDGNNAKLPFDDDSVDLIVCTEVLEHLVMGTPLVREFGRVLKPGGVAVISVPNVCSLKSRIKVVTGRLPNLAASGDCGHPLGGTGVLIDGNWVAGHVVDFNFARLQDYLLRGDLRVVDSVALPFGLKVAGRSLTILPAFLMTATFSDFLLVAARKEIA